MYIEACVYFTCLCGVMGRGDNGLIENIKKLWIHNQCVSRHMFSLYLVFKIICIKQINEFERNCIEKQFIKFMHFENPIILTIEKWEQKTHWITASNKILNVVQNIKRITFSQIIVTITNMVVTARPNLPYIVRFVPYRPHGSVPGDASPVLSLTPQNTYDKLATSTLNKASYHSLTRRCGILQSTPLKEPDDPVGTTG